MKPVSVSILLVTTFLSACTSERDLGEHGDQGSSASSTEGGAPGAPAGTAPGAGPGADGAPGATSLPEAGAVPVAPASVPGVIVWLAAGVGQLKSATGDLLRWQDQSGHGNDASSKDAPNFGPQIDPGAAAGHDSVVLTSNKYLTIADADSSRFGQSDLAIVMVARLPNLVSNECRLWRKEPTTDQGLRLAVNSVRSYGVLSSVLVAGMEGTKVQVPAPDVTKLHVYTMRGRPLRIRIDGVTSPGASAFTDADLSYPGKRIEIGVTSDYGRVDIAEVVAIKGAVSDADLDGLEAHLRSKFRL